VRQRGICLLVVVSMILSACTTQIGALEKASCSRATAVTYTNCLVATLDLTPQDQKAELTQELIVALVAVMMPLGHPHGSSRLGAIGSTPRRS
jgi:hypothetical protein